MALIALIREVGAEAPRREGRARRARHLRRLAVLRRRDDHAGDLGAVGGRGARGGRAGASSSLVVPITLVILTVLFAIQRFGTGAVGRLFGPVMGVWFRVLAVAGLREVVDGAGRSCARSRRPTRSRSSSTTRARRVHRARLGGADRHRRRGAVRRHGPLRPPADPPRVVLLVFPALMLNYMGQGALILARPEAIDNPFFLLIPEWARIPMVRAGDGGDGDRLAGGDLRRVLGHPPGGAARLPAAPDDPAHLAQEVGQVYVPAVNWGIFVAVVALVVGFGSSAAAGVRLRHRGHRHAGDRHDPVLRRRPHAVEEAGCGWSIAGAARLPDRRPRVLRRQRAEDRARRLVPARDRRAGVRRADDVAARARDRHRATGPSSRARCATSSRSCATPTTPITRAPAPAIFLDANPETTPLALRDNVEHNHVLHESVVIVSVEDARRAARATRTSA